MKYLKCDRCDEHPGYLVRLRVGELLALCFSCWNPVRAEVKVVDWIIGSGRRKGCLQFGVSE